MADGSQPAPVRLLAHEALLTFDMAIVMADRINGLPEGPDKAQAWSDLRDSLMTYRPVLRGVISAQEQAAEALNLSQSRSVRVLASIGVPAEQPDAANSEHPTTPEQPTPSVA